MIDIKVIKVNGEITAVYADGDFNVNVEEFTIAEEHDEVVTSNIEGLRQVA